MATIKQIADGGPDGTLFGASSTDLIGFYGLTTPIVRPSATAQSAITAGATTTSCNALVIELRLALVNLGLIAGG